LSETEALKLTTAKYYTPSGRCIHKDHRTSRQDDKVAAIPNPSSKKNASGEDSEETDGAETFTTVGGRPVLGGGGITPDIEIPQANLTEYAVNLERQNFFFEFAIKYIAKHPNLKEVKVTDTMFDEFKQLMETESKAHNPDKEYVFDAKGFSDNAEYVNRGIRREMIRRLHGSKAAYMVQIEGDEQLKRALDLFKRGTTVKQLYALSEKDITPLSDEAWKRLLHGR